MAFQRITRTICSSLLCLLALNSPEMAKASDAIVSEFLSSALGCPEENSAGSSLKKLMDLRGALRESVAYGKGCVEREVYNPILKPIIEESRKQSLALSLCQENASCLSFLRHEASRVSHRPESFFSDQNASQLFTSILRTSSRTRISPISISELPLSDDPEAMLNKLKELIADQAPAEQETNRDWMACEVFASLVGPAKLGVFGKFGGKFERFGTVPTSAERLATPSIAAKISAVANSTRKLNSIEMSHDINKLLKNNRLPPQVKTKLEHWKSAVEKDGLTEVKKIPGFHDEPLQGRHGVHSIRLSDGFRACYEVILKEGAEVLRVFSISNDHKNYCRH